VKNKKITVGILIGNVCSLHFDDLLKGLVHRAEDCDVQTLFFMGAHANYFDRLYNCEGKNKEQKYLFQFNTVFDYAKLGKLDVLIIAYSTFYLYMDESKEDFFDRFKDMDIPIIIVGDEYKNYISVILDNSDGIRKCMEHLIIEHGCKKIGYLSGPKENNRDASERLAAYYQVMKEYNLEVREEMIAYGDYSAKSASAFGAILDNNPDIEAVVCANDTMALAGYEECKKRGLEPGRDIAITGFDDISAAKLVFPSLTTVEQNSYDLGYMAMKKAVELCENGNLESVKVPVYFKHRESCGSEKKIEEVFQKFPEEYTCEQIARQCSEEILEKVFLYKISIVEDKKIYDILYKVCYHIVDVYLGEEEKEYDVEFIYTSLYTLINSGKLAISDFITELCRQIASIIFMGKDNIRKGKISSILLHILNYVENVTAIDSDYKVDALQKHIWTTPFIIRDMLCNIDDNTQMYECLMERLQFMMADNAYLFLLPKPKINHNISEWCCPEELYLVTKIEDGKILGLDRPQILNKENGIRDFISWQNCKNMAVYTIFAENKMYGILVCEMTADNIISMYSTSLHIGSAVQFIELTRNQRKIQAELEQAMTMLKNKNIILNMMSEKDELTQLYNRRGFLKNAISMMERAKPYYLLCIYADLNYLKEINDQFGHAEGDFAIKQAGEYLRTSLRSTDVIGRIGGDEFVALAIIQSEHMGREICDRIISNSNRFNENSDKPYYIEMSVGYAVYKWSEDLEIDQMLSGADKMLYKSKKKKRKEVRKNVDGD
jgi:diguanylate cyclase (GGDEF)-like protein